MTTNEFLVNGIAAVLATLPAVWMIPRQRQSPAFDRVLLAATWLLAFLAGLGVANMVGEDSPLNFLAVAQVAVIPTLIGAALGAFSINGLLGLMDRFAPPSVEEDLETDEEENARTNPPNQQQ